jgi:hypothetical protein
MSQLTTGNAQASPFWIAGQPCDQAIPRGVPVQRVESGGESIENVGRHQSAQR